MPANLLDLIQTLEAEKAQHAQVTAAIATTLEQISGLLGALIGGHRVAKPVASAAKAHRRVSSAPAAKALTMAKSRKTPKTFAMTGAESVLAFVRKNGNPTTAQIRQHWNSEGRGGTGKTVLSKLVTEKKLKREPLKDGRGSRYKIA